MPLSRQQKTESKPTEPPQKKIEQYESNDYDKTANKLVECNFILERHTNDKI